MTRTEFIARWLAVPNGKASPGKAGIRRELARAIDAYEALVRHMPDQPDLLEEISAQDYAAEWLLRQARTDAVDLDKQIDEALSAYRFLAENLGGAR